MITVVTNPEVIYSHSTTIVPILMLIIIALVIGVYVYCKYFKNKNSVSHPIDMQNISTENQRNINLLPLTIARYREDPIVEELL